MGSGEECIYIYTNTIAITQHWWRLSGVCRDANDSTLQKISKFFSVERDIYAGDKLGGILECITYIWFNVIQA